jgi:hypothetical protein
MSAGTIDIEIATPVAESDRTGLGKDALRRAFLDNLYWVQGKFPALATPHDHCMALAYTVRDRMLQGWISTAAASPKACRPVIRCGDARAVERETLEAGGRSPPFRHACARLSKKGKPRQGGVRRAGSCSASAQPPECTQRAQRHQCHGIGLGLGDRRRQLDRVAPCLQIRLPRTRRSES